MSAQPTTSETDRIYLAILRAGEIALERGEPITSARLTALADRLERSDFNVVVVGAFKRGKSTLVNALVGAPILPTGVLPQTSVVTRLRWAPAPTTAITSEDGTTRWIPLAGLEGFVTEAGNPRNHLRVASAEVSMPADILRSGGVLVDTPGVGSTFEHNTETTLRALEDVDAAVFVTAPDPPMSEDERRFLIAVRRHAHKMFFVLNKMDILDDDEAGEVITFTRSVIGTAVGDEVTVYPISARLALREADPGFDRFSDGLAAFLDRDLARTGSSSVAAKACLAIDRIRAGIAVELEALHLSIEEIERRRERLAEVRRGTEATRRELEALVQAHVGELLSWIAEELATWRSGETDRLLQEADRAMAGSTTHPAELARSIDDLLRDDIEAWRPGLEAAVRSRSSKARDALASRAEAAASRAAEAAAEIFDLRSPTTPPIEGLPDESRFTYGSFEVPTVAQSLLPDAAKVLPTRWAAGIALRRARRRIPMIVDRHSGRIRHDLATRLERSARELIRALDRHLGATTEGLDEALARAEASADSVERSGSDAAPPLLALDRELRSLVELLRRQAGRSQELA
jgi:Dynamin family